MKKEKRQDLDAPNAFPSRLNAGINWTVLIFAVAALAVVINRPTIVVTETKNGTFLASSYKFSENTMDHSRLRLLRQREHLDEVIAPGQTQFEKIVRLRHWASTQWKSEGKPFYYPAWDAVEILDLSRQHHNNGFCAQYAMVFLQACQAVGLHARYVELFGHFIVGVWSDEYNRWVLMDPTNDIHYEKNGVPMRGAALCLAYWKKQSDGIFKVKADGTKTPVTVDDLNPYRMYSIVQRADQLDKPPVIRVNRQTDRVLVRESDYTKYPLIGRDDLQIGSPYLAWKEKSATEHFTDKPETDDPDEFMYPLNQAFLFVARRNAEGGIVKVILYPENTPTFDKFMINIDSQGWAPFDKRELVWQLKPGFNFIEARVRTDGGWEGPISSLKIYYKPRWFGKA